MGFVKQNQHTGSTSGKCYMRCAVLVEVRELEGHRKLPRRHHRLQLLRWDRLQLYLRCYARCPIGVHRRTRSIRIDVNSYKRKRVVTYLFSR